MAKQVRIAGLVRLTDAVRRELAQPLSPDRRNRLRVRAAQAIQQVERTVREAGSRIDRLPAPSRRALQFLKSIDWEKVPLAPEGHVPATDRHVTWRGLVRFVDRVMDRLAVSSSEQEIESIRRSIEKTSRQIEGTIGRQKLTPGELSPGSREMRGWLALFSVPENMAAYVEAQKLAHATLRPALVGHKRFLTPLRIQFRPMRRIYRIRVSRHGSLLCLPTPMITFGADEFADLASLIFGQDRRAHRRVLELMTAEGFQSMRAELESLSGIVRETRGAFHDLTEAFDRMNARYFNGVMSRPRLTWSRSFTGRKFGHYDWILDTVMVSRTLDSSDVPSFVVDFIVYHELLHKKHGLHWVKGRGYAHTAKFYQEERNFERHSEAEAVIKRLAGIGSVVSA